MLATTLCVPFCVTGQAHDDVYGAPKTDKRSDKYRVDGVLMPFLGPDIVFERIFEYKNADKSKIYNLAREYFKERG